MKTAKEVLLDTANIEIAMINFARMHVKAAKKDIKAKAAISLNGGKGRVMYSEHSCGEEEGRVWAVNKKSIQKAYPLKNIK